MTNADQIKLETFDNFINWLNDAALENLDKKHRGLTTVEQIDKLTKDIEKLCK